MGNPVADTPPPPQQSTASVSPADRLFGNALHAWPSMVAVGDYKGQHRTSATGPLPPLPGPGGMRLPFWPPSPMIIPVSALFCDVAKFCHRPRCVNGICWFGEMTAKFPTAYTITVPYGTRGPEPPAQSAHAPRLRAFARLKAGVEHSLPQFVEGSRRLAQQRPGRVLLDRVTSATHRHYQMRRS
jgi:hypothetical protein